MLGVLRPRISVGTVKFLGKEYRVYMGNNRSRIVRESRLCCASLLREPQACGSPPLAPQRRRSRLSGGEPAPAGPLGLRRRGVRQAWALGARAAQRRATWARLQQQAASGEPPSSNKLLPKAPWPTGP